MIRSTETFPCLHGCSDGYLFVFVHNVCGYKVNERSAKFCVTGRL